MKTTVVGSYPIPEWLKSCPNEETLIDATTVVIQTQLRIGIDVISDGELLRWNLESNMPSGMAERFVAPMSGISTDLSRSELEEFRARPDVNYRQKPAGIVTEELGEGILNLGYDWSRIRFLTNSPFKFTVTSPYMLAKVVSNMYYVSLTDLAFAFADILANQLAHIDATVIQIDEPNLIGHPEDGHIASQAINRVLEAVSSEKNVHLCFGNYHGQTIQDSNYKYLISFMNQLNCDCLVLELTRRPKDEIRYLCDVQPNIQFGIGVVDVKDLQIETPEQIAHRIEDITEILGPERIAYVNPDCGLRMLPRTVAEAKLKALVAGRNLYCGITNN